MVKALLYDYMGYLFGEPEVPDSPLPRVVVWGDDTYVVEGVTEDGRPRYRQCSHYVVDATRGSGRFRL